MIQENIKHNEEVLRIFKTLSFDKAVSKKITLPARNDIDLNNLETFSCSDDGTRSLRVYLKNINSVSLYSYFRMIVQYFFDNTKKYTWTGKTSSTKPGDLPESAKKLNIVDIAIGTLKSAIKCCCVFPYIVAYFRYRSN